MTVTRRLVGLKLPTACRPVYWLGLAGLAAIAILAACSDSSAPLATSEPSSPPIPETTPTSTPVPKVALALDADATVAGYWSDGTANVEIAMSLRNEGDLGVEDAHPVAVTCLQGGKVINGCGSETRISLSDGYGPPHKTAREFRDENLAFRADLHGRIHRLRTRRFRNHTACPDGRRQWIATTNFAGCPETAPR